VPSERDAARDIAQMLIPGAATAAEVVQDMDNSNNWNE
jgi:hypothetical protein